MPQVSRDDPRLLRVRLRTEVQAIDAEIEKIQEEDRLFRRCGFGSDVHEIKLTALRAERADRVTALARSRARSRRRPAGRGGIGSWLALPAVLGAVVLQAFSPKRRSAVQSHRKRR